MLLLHLPSQFPFSFKQRGRQESISRWITWSPSCQGKKVKSRRSSWSFATRWEGSILLLSAPIFLSKETATRHLCSVALRPPFPAPGWPAGPHWAQCGWDPLGEKGSFQAAVVTCILFPKTKGTSAPTLKPQRKGNPSKKMEFHWFGGWFTFQYYNIYAP